MDLNEWPDCPVEGCENKICLSLNSSMCFPHTPGNKHIKHMKIDARNADFNNIIAVDEYQTIEWSEQFDPVKW